MLHMLKLSLSLVILIWMLLLIYVKSSNVLLLLKMNTETPGVHLLMESIVNVHSNKPSVTFGIVKLSTMSPLLG